MVFGRASMFKDYLLADKSRKPAPEKVIGAWVSLLLHGFLIYGIYNARITVRIMPLEKEEVRDIVIVPPLKASIPRIVGGRGGADIPDGLPEEGLYGLGPERGAAGTLPEPHAGPEPGFVRPAASDAAPPGRPSEPPGPSAVPSLSTRFWESLSSRHKGGEGSGLTIVLSPPGSPYVPSGGAVGTEAGPYPDFTKYIASPFAGVRGRYGTGSGRRGGGSGFGQRVGVSIPLKGYDLAPWAVKAVDRIQRFWDLPSVSVIPEDTTIRVIVVLKKNGELDSIEILDRTSAEALDRSALEALRASIPFPPLPDDFPGDLLEIHFEFVYGLK